MLPTPVHIFNDDHWEQRWFVSFDLRPGFNTTVVVNYDGSIHRSYVSYK